MRAGVVYALIDPRTDAVRYVGRTSRPPEWRRRRHMKDAVTREHHTHKTRWIRQLASQGLEPRIVVLEECGEDSTAVREIWWISEMRQRGCDLTNTGPGGEGTAGHGAAVRAGMQRTNAHARSLATRRANGNDVHDLPDAARAALQARTPEQKRASALKMLETRKSRAKN